ncbi:hypothetical protein BFJ63_vAg15236 [Fusarium oxysporum f. sp. narcissi]|uniref:LysM domain-containing protein n=1 Tax=Fusarium oxysporum f. sp. narcissi TaxID=451672 RepID=A0A4Q2V9R8_FUSOX|nr:hypothetical protein BFJ63_vAg15236 [Fusarium oxysporum f. sp. narcissi]
MKEVLWLSSLSLVSAICASNYAIWISQDRTPLDEAIGRALPGLKYEEVEALNHRFNIHSTEPGRIYKIPYDESVTPIEPASWSGDCPRTLVLDGNTRVAEAAPSSVPNPTIIRARNHLFGSDAMDLKVRSVGTSDGSETTKTPAAVGSTTTSAPAPTGTANKMRCWSDSYPASSFEASWDSRMGFATLFCDKLNDIRLDAQLPIQEEPYGDTFLGMTILPGCPNYSIGAEGAASCRAVMEQINHKCPKSGGLYYTDCLLYYFVPK